jgi:U3 small nucleolar RNA-associated protein 10
MSNKVTSLSAQLKRLQVPQTSILSKLGETRRSSFLFDPKEAANMDSESVYCLAMNGLEQLKAIDREAFGSFEATLFAQSSITYERLVQTKEVNVQLDAELRRFLLHLTPYFMLKPAHKCFEWLVYKYKVHVYNVDDVFMCVLPYHDTNYFVRALQLIDFSDEFNNAATWSWLLDNQKRG